MEIFELIIDEEKDGIQAISLVEQPAIESDWITLNKQTDIQLSLDKERRVLMGAALIPNKTIYRKDGDKEYYIYFSKDTVRKASELFLKNGFQNETTVEHIVSVDGNTVVESWITEDKEKDKTNLHNIDVPVGTWMISMKVSEGIWDLAKKGAFKGFSIEGAFVDKVVNNKSEYLHILEELTDYLIN